ncbi:MAG: hypothetical protein PHG06_17685 [Parabacteroides sp.]|nr:hypothetical protein [Parabacteroides sp.]
MWVLFFITWLLVLVPACGSDGSKPDATENNGFDMGNPFEENYIVHWLTGSDQSIDYEGNRYDELLLEEIFNVDIRIWRLSPEDRYIFKMYLESGNLPDVGFYGSLASIDTSYSKEDLHNKGFIQPVPMNALKTHMPSLYRIYENNTQYYTYCQADEKIIYSLPIIAVNHMIPRYVNLFNYDWLLNIGFQFDNLLECRFPQTPEYESYEGKLYFASNKLSIDEFTDILRKFTYDDPDGNGEDDTYGLYKDTYSNIIVQLFGQIAYMINYDEELDRCIPYFADRKQKDLIVWEAEAIKEGFVVARGINSQNKPPVTSQQYGYVNVPLATVFTNIARTSTLPVVFNREVVTTIPSEFDPVLPKGDARYVIMPVPGEKGGFAAYDYSLYVKGNEYVFARMEQDKMDRILSMLEYAFFGENNFFFLYGKENVHFIWSGEPYASVPVMKDPRTLDEPYRAETLMGQLGNIYFRMDPFYLFNYESSIVNFYRYFFNYYTYEDLFIAPYKYFAPSALTNDPFDGNKNAYYNLISPLNSLKNEVMNGYVTDIEQAFDQYLTLLYQDRDFQKLLEYINDDRFVRYKGSIVIDENENRGTGG